jgi:hypothetical protein
VDFQHFHRSIFLCQPSKNAFGARTFPEVKTEVTQAGKGGYQAQYRSRPTPLPLHAKPSVRRLNPSNDSTLCSTEQAVRKPAAYTDDYACSLQASQHCGHLG